MTRLLARNPAVIALAMLAVGGVLVANWGIGVTVDDQGFSWTGAPTEAQLWELRIVRIASQAPPPAVLVAVTAVIGILVIGSATQRSLQRGTLALGADAPTRNAVTAADSSPSSSNSSDDAPIPMSTARE